MHIFFYVFPIQKINNSLSVSSSTKASCAGAHVCIILMNILRLVRLAPGCALCHNLMGGWMMRWKPSHGGYKPGFPGSMLPAVVLRMRLHFLQGIACFSSMDIADCGRRNKQTFCVFHPPHTPFLQGWASSQKRFCDWCLSVLCVYLFVWQTDALLTSHCHMFSSQRILRLHQGLSIQVQMRWGVTAEP